MIEYNHRKGKGIKMIMKNLFKLFDECMTEITNCGFDTG